MQRRDFIKGMAAAGTIATIGRRAHAVVSLTDAYRSRTPRG